MYFLSTLFIFIAFHVNQGGLMTRDAQISFFSEAPIENISAVSKTGIVIYNPQTGVIQFGVAIRSFKFQKALMQEHFNENYMESDKFPIATFKGTIDRKLDPEVNGEYQVKAVGILEIHGVAKKRMFSGLASVSNGKITLTSNFDVKCAEHQIKIPTLLFKNIAETIKVTLKVNFASKQ